MVGRLVEHVRPEGGEPMPAVEERSRYQSDFGVSWLRLPILTAVALLTAIALEFWLRALEKRPAIKDYTTDRELPRSAVA